jgi:P pilus assembly chaperone PapD
MLRLRTEITANTRPVPVVIEDVEVTYYQALKFRSGCVTDLTLVEIHNPTDAPVTVRALTCTRDSDDPTDWISSNMQPNLSEAATDVTVVAGGQLTVALTAQRAGSYVQIVGTVPGVQVTVVYNDLP